MGTVQNKLPSLGASGYILEHQGRGTVKFNTGAKMNESSGNQVYLVEETVPAQLSSS